MNLFVAKLNPATTSQDLQKLFAHYGYVTKVKVIIDHETGRSKGYGFVEMPNPEEANEALKELDSAMFQQTIIIVKNSQPTTMRNQTAENESNRNQSIKLWGQQHYVRDTTRNTGTFQGQGGRRNFGYRGSGFKSTGQY